MYRCDKCGCVVESGQKAMRVVVETREVRYDNGGSGVETAKELKVCGECRHGLGGPPPEPKEPKRPEYHGAAPYDEDPPPPVRFELQLANGKSLRTNAVEQVYWFWRTDGASIAKPAKRPAKGGKSKGARGKGRKTVHQTRNLRVEE